MERKKFPGLLTLGKWCTTVVLVLTAAVLFAGYQRGYQLYSVQSDSMYPYVAAGGAVLVSRNDRVVAPGDVVTYKSPDLARGTNTHRVVAVDRQRGLMTSKGDNTAAIDAVVPLRNVVGTVSFVIPGAGYGLDSIKHPLGLAALVYAPVAGIIFAELQRLSRAWRPRPPQHYLLYR